MKAQKEQLAQLARKVHTSQAQQDTAEAQLLQQERSAAQQVSTAGRLAVGYFFTRLFHKMICLGCS